MPRDVKRLGLGFLLSLALSGTATTAASAEPFAFHADGDYITFTANQNSVFTVDGGTLECEEIRQIGEVIDIATSFTTFELATTWHNCNALGFPADVDMNGCNVVLNAGTKVGAAYEGSAGIACPPNEEITMTVTALGVAKCTVHIPEQGPLGTVTYENGSGNFYAEANISGFEYSQTAGTGIGACKTVSGTTNGTLVGGTIVSGDNKSEKLTNLWVE
jgi:hypothetical protein